MNHKSTTTMESWIQLSIYELINEIFGELGGGGGGLLNPTLAVTNSYHRGSSNHFRRCLQHSRNNQQPARQI